MPFYDYRCASCGDFRLLRHLSEAGTSPMCPGCGLRSEKVLSAPFLAGSDAGRWRAPNNSSTPGRVRWRSACGFGCTHCAAA
jgi:putative FmdB family regulatory protein